MVIGIDASRAFVSAKTGTENYSYHVIKHMLRLPESAQHKFVLFTRPNVQTPDWVQRNNVIIKQISIKYLWTQVGLAWETWREPLDVLWIPAHTLPVLRKPGLATVVTIHGLEYRWLPEYRNWLQRWYLPLSTYYAAKQATRLIAVSESTKNDLLREIKTDAKKIKVIYEGVDCENNELGITNDAEQRIYAKYGIQNTKYVLFVGTIQPRKNLRSLIQAWNQIESKFPDYKLVLAGGVGWMAEEVLSTPQELGIGDRVVFTGRVTDLALQALYQGAALYVQPSFTEGFGLPILEAMKSGVAVVTSDGGALPEVIGEAGAIVPLGADFERVLAERINELLTNKKESEKLIAKGYKRVGYFAWERTAKATLLTILG